MGGGGREEGGREGGGREGATCTCREGTREGERGEGKEKGREKRREKEIKGGRRQESVDEGRVQGSATFKSFIFKRKPPKIA